jgi:hypothetical protein
MIGSEGVGGGVCTKQDIYRYSNVSQREVDATSKTFVHALHRAIRGSNPTIKMGKAQLDLIKLIKCKPNYDR